MRQIEVIQDSIDYIEENLKTEITAAELASRAGKRLMWHKNTGLTLMPVFTKPFSGKSDLNQPPFWKIIRQKSLIELIC